ncbi:MAG: SH3 domain-containing protein [Acidaminococcaceae bacterium]
MFFYRNLIQRAFLACLVIYFVVGTGVYNVAAEGTGSANIRSVTRNEELFDAEYPMVYGLESEAAQDLINGDIDKYVQQFYTGVEDSGSRGKLRYSIYKNANNTLSMTLKIENNTADKKKAVSTYGLNYNLITGKPIDLSNYYNKEAVLNRAQDGLKYVYKLEKDKTLLYPENYYIDTDDNVIAIYHAGAIADRALGEIEVDLTAADEIKVKETPPSDMTGKLEEGIIVGADVRLRQQPGLNTKIIGVLQEGESVRLGKQQTVDGLSWTYIVRKNNDVGWVATQYCKKTAEDVAVNNTEKGLIIGEEVRLRSEPNLNADILDLFAKGEKIEIIERLNANGREWCKVKRSNGSIGWVAAEYCQ